MEKEITIGVSNRHIHLTKEVYDYLFNDEYEVLRNLSQPGMFVTNKTVTLKTDNYEISNVKLLGPLREYNQVEISHNDALKFKIDPPVRTSGDLKGASSITIIGEKNQITLNAAIISQRHIHISPEQANNLGLKDNDIVKVHIPGIKSGTVDTHIKITNNALLEMHIDTDDANAFLISNDNNKGTLII